MLIHIHWTLGTWRVLHVFFFKLGCGFKNMQAPKNPQKLELWTIRQIYLPKFFSAVNLALGNQAVHRDGKGMFYYGLRQLNFLAGRTGSKGNTHSIMFTVYSYSNCTHREGEARISKFCSIKCPFWDSNDFENSISGENSFFFYRWGGVKSVPVQWPKWDLNNFSTEQGSGWM